MVFGYFIVFKIVNENFGCVYFGLGIVYLMWGEFI